MRAPCGDWITRSTLRVADWRISSILPASSRRAASSNIAALLRDLEDHLAAFPRLHGGEPALELLQREAVGEHGAHVKAALQHGLHLVPGLEDLPAVDALYRQALEDHLVPTDPRGVRENPQEGNAPAVVHVLQHRLEDSSVARHLQPDVEADDGEPLPRLLDRASRDIR